MEAQILLCEYANVDAQGRLNIIGGGWTVNATNQPLRFSIAMRMITAWTEANTRHHFRLRLLTQDGATVLGPRGNPMFGVEGEFEVGRPPGFVEGEDLVSCVAIDLPPLDFQSGMYELRLEVGDEVVGRAPFRVVRQPGRQGGMGGISGMGGILQ